MSAINCRNVVLTLVFVVLGAIRCSPFYRKDIQNKELLPYIRSFERDCNVSVGTDVVFTSSLPRTIAGQCRFVYLEPYSRGRYIIVISRYWWSMMGHWGRHQLVYHELGHCVLGKDDDNRTRQWNGVDIPLSIMYYRSFGDDVWYVNNVEYYIRQLCK